MKYTAQKAFFAGLLTCTILTGVPYVMAADIAATTTWQISRVASLSQGSYCAMAQKFADDTILTVARNGRSEYSLAIERPNAKFEMGKEQSVTLRPDGGSSQTYTAINQTEKTVIVGIGASSPVISQLAKSGKMSIEIAKIPVTYAFANYEQGAGDLDKCIVALASSKDATADMAKSPLTGATSAAPQVSRQVSKIESSSGDDVMPVVAPSVAPSVEGLLAAKPSPMSGAEALNSSEAVPVKTVVKEPVKNVTAVVTPKTEVAAKEIVVDAPLKNDELSLIKEENARLKRTIVESRKSFEDKQANKTGPAVDELKSKLDVAAADNEKLQHKLSALQNELAAKEAAPKIAPVMTPMTPDVDDSNTKGDDTEDKLRAELRAARAQSDALQAEKAALQASIEKLQRESETTQLKVTGGSWDLEQATRRYQESQREIRRLGALLDGNNQKCQQEKKDIEYMLFDPEIAKKAQISMLNNMEDQIAEKDKKIIQLQALAETPKITPAQEIELANLKQQVMSLQQQTVIASTAAKDLDLAKVKLAESEKNLAAVKAQDLKNTAQLQELQAKLADVQTNIDGQKAAEMKKMAEAQVSSDAQKIAMASLNETLSKSNQKVLALEAQLAESQTKIDAANKTAILVSQSAAKELQDAKEKNLAAAATLAQVSAASGVEMAKNMAVAPPVQAANVVPTAPVQNVSLATPPQSSPFMSADMFSQTLKSAGIPISNGVSVVAGGDPNTYRAYSWKTENLFGSVEMRKVGLSDSLESIVQKYLARAKSRCAGDFAAVPSIIPASGKGYEIACVTKGANSSASVVFSYRNGIVMTVAHEGNADMMDVAIEARDKIAIKL